MDSAFSVVIWVVVAIGIVIAVGFLLSSRSTWEDFGRHGMVRDSDTQSAPAPGSAASMRERQSDMRALVEARNAVRARRGQPPIDVEEELARAAAPRVDPGLEAEIRDLVIARNHRRAKSGKPPLDIDAEVRREIAKLSDRL